MKGTRHKLSTRIVIRGVTLALVVAAAWLLGQWIVPAVLKAVFL